METSGFFNAERLPNQQFDRVYLAEFFAKYFASFIGNGVFGGRMAALQVVLSGTFGVRVQSGQGYINGYWYENSADVPFSLSSGGSQPRIDTVVLRLDFVTRRIRLAMLTGTPSASPTAPVLTRNANVWELGLANINIAANATSITAVNIVDTRLDTARCGLVHGVVNQLDTTEYGDRLNGFIDSYIAGVSADYQNLFLDPINALMANATTFYNNTFLLDLNTTLGLATAAYNDFLAWIESKKTSSTQEIQDLVDQLNQILGDADVGAILVRLNNLDGIVSGLGTAAFEPVGVFATAAQGALANSALQTETDPIYTADKPTLVTLDTPQVITAAKTFQVHPIVPGVSEQTAFTARQPDRYVTEAQLAAGGVGASDIIIHHMDTALANLFSITRRFVMLTRKNGFVIFDGSAQLASDFTPAGDIFNTGLPNGYHSALSVFIPLVVALAPAQGGSFYVGHVQLFDGEARYRFSSNVGTFPANTWVACAGMYAHV